MKGTISTFTDMLANTSSKYYNEDYVDASVSAPSDQKPQPATVRYVYNSLADAHVDHIALGQRLDTLSTRCIQEAYMASASMLSSRSTAPFTGAMLLPIAPPAALHLPNLDSAKQLEKEVRRLSDATQQLIEKFEARLQAVERSVGSPPDAQTTTAGFHLNENVDATSFLSSGEQAISDKLNAIADNEITSPVWAGVAIAALANASPNVRAAASRALRTLAPEEARQAVTAAIDRESNKVTARVMRSVLRSLDA